MFFLTTFKLISGYSQGGLIARGIVQTFPNVSVSTFISLSSPQAGQYGGKLTVMKLYKQNNHIKVIFFVTDLYC